MEVAFWALGEDYWMFIYDVDLIVPVPVEEVISEACTCLRGKGAILNGAGACGEAVGEVDCVELAWVWVNVGHVPRWRGFTAVLSSPV